MRILGKGLTAKALFEYFQNASMYDDGDLEHFDPQSDEPTIVSPGIPPHNDLVLKSKNLISEYDAFSDVMPFSIWISGTNGKTTTTQMLDFLLASHGASTGGNIGTPLAKLDQKANMWILETSSFTLHYTNKAYPNIYILLPISEDHIYWHGSYEAYREAKLKPLSMMKEGDVAIIPQCFENYPTSAHLITYSNTQDICDHFGLNIGNINFVEPFKLDAALALGVYKILFDKLMEAKLNLFKVDAHKVELFHDALGRLWVDDSKATNVDATIWALKNFIDKQIFIILGGDDKGADLTPLFDELKQYNIEIFAIGKNQEKIKQFCLEYGLNFNICGTIDIAVELMKTKHNHASIAMLSPAAASLDQFSGYKQRGEIFKSLVLKV